MSGVYIKSMEMPTRCCECRLSTCHSFNERPLCDVLVEYMSYGEWQAKRLDNCPLVPVPPHRLIDREQILDAISLELAQANAVNDMEDYDAWMRVFDYVRKFPIIPTECGCCDWDCTESVSFNYCPNCGADMREGN